MSTDLPFPPPGKFLAFIRESSKAARETADIKIETKSITRLLTSPAFTTTFKRVSAHHGLALPLKFSSTLDELNLISILALLNIGSGYRTALHGPGGPGRGAWDSIRAFVFSMYITSATGEGDLMSARGMMSMQEPKVAELLGANMHIEKPHPTIPGIIVGELGGPLYELVKLITELLNETGGVLHNMGYPNLGALVAETLEQSKLALNEEAAMDGILERLVRAIPGFRDMATVNGQNVYCFKKALFLIHSITVRFGSITPPPFPLPSTTRSPIFTDNVIPSMLVHLGIMELPPSMSTNFPHAGSAESLETLLALPPMVVAGVPKQVPKQGPVLSTEQAYLLRASAIDACEMMVQVAHSMEALPEELLWIKDITLPELDMWLWAVAKDRPDYRQLERFVLLDTVFF